ncbi:MAG: DUF748 domain-containing protein [Candidatus Scalindua sp.]|nr:DUF748 domain-containing protein [Candidatus Scalindua sp.]
MGIRSFCKSLPLTMKVVIVIAILFLLYTVCGFFIAPTIVKSKLLSSLAKQTGRKVIVKKIKLNPLALSFTMKGFEMNELNGERFFSFEELYVNLQFSSLFRSAFTFAEIRLIAPDGQMKIMPDGKFNFSDLIPAPAVNDTSKEKSSNIPPIFVSQLKIKQGRMAFADLSHPTPFKTTVIPIQVSLENFSTERDAVGQYLFTAKTREGEGVSCEGDISVNPLGAHGKLTLSGVKTNTLWKYIQDQVGFVISDGLLDMVAGYSIDMSGEPIYLKLVDGTMQLEGLELVEKKNMNPVLSIPSLSVTCIDIDLSNREAVVGAVYLKKIRFQDSLDKDGIMYSQKLFFPEVSSEKGGQSFSSTNKTVSEEQKWSFTLNEMKMEDSRIVIENHTLTEIQQVKLQSVNVNLKGVSNKKDSKMEVTLDLGLNDTGSVKMGGQVGINPIFAVINTQAAQLPLHSFQPTLNSFTEIDVVEGTANLDGRVTYMSPGSEGPVIRYEGAASIDGLRITDRAYSEDLLRWESLSLNGIVFDVMPYRCNISEILISKPYAKVIIWQDGTLNLSRVMSMPDREVSEGKLLLSQVLPERDEKGEENDQAMAADSSGRDHRDFPITVKEIRFEDCSADFADLSLKKNFATAIHGLNGSVKGLTSEPGTRANVLLNGNVDDHAPVNIEGTINLLSDDKYTDMSLSFKNMELTTVTPYSAKFAGYPIKKGKMSLDLKYHLSENILVGENAILIDQLTLGDRIESEDATKLPVKLAIALLKDRHGRIDIDLPVRGDLNDPEFDYGRVLIKALVNMVTKIVTSPFSALSRLAGGGDEDLGSIEFEFGSSKLSDVEIGKLGKLAKAIYERPWLLLEIKAFADGEKDRMALAGEELNKRLKQGGGKIEQVGQAPTPAGDITFSDEEYGRLIIKAYEKDFGHHPGKLFGIDGVRISKYKDSVPDAQQKAPAETEKLKRDGSHDIDLPVRGDLNGPEFNHDRVVIKTLVNMVTKIVTSPFSALYRLTGGGDEDLGSIEDPKSIEQEVVVTAAKKCLIENIVIDNVRLRMLARERAKQIKGFLIEKGGIPNRQIFVLDSEIKESSNADRILTNLSLSAR